MSVHTDRMDSGWKPSTAQMVLLATSSALTAIFYSKYKSRARTVARLKEAKKVSIDQDLKTLLSETPGQCIPYAVIEGVVRSVKDNLNSQFVENCQGVIQRLTLKEKKKVWNWITHLWHNTETVILRRNNMVPFVLGSHDDSITATVRVMRPLDAAELDLETTYINFSPTVQSLSSVIVHFIIGERPQGINETEEMLRLGDVITGVGELVLDNNLIKLQPPKEEFCYYLTRLDYASLLRKWGKSMRLWQILTVVFGVAACSTLLFLVWRGFVRHRQMQRERCLLKEFMQHQKKRMQELNLEESSVSPNSCSLCLSRDRSCVFLDCGHVCACSHCYNALPQPKKCPICRENINRVVPLYNS
ncbi:mitochondrial ubiquitin ligase activator of NFKB 1 [Antennarius striatus]|uniref:mitochondrial ubiquitin ligase activator of NFKB 1 n=1 Tax=Antennarius striatus TaxID=241820 RepID=UPI0035AEBE41